jgi:hypothetical protein
MFEELFVGRVEGLFIKKIERLFVGRVDDQKNLNLKVTLHFLIRLNFHLGSLFG